MIPRLDGWSWETRHDGIVTAPPEGKGLGFVRYCERRRPLVRLRDVAAELERDTRFRIVNVGTPERIITDEGEYAGLLTVDGLLLEAPVQHTLAAVFLDDYFSLIDGVALRRDAFLRMNKHVRLLALNDMHCEGEARRRRFFYTPPAHWNGIARFLTTFWYPFDYPRNPSCIAVHPAIPVAPGWKDFIDAVASDEMNASGSFAVQEVSEPQPFATKNKLTGSQWEGIGSSGAEVRYRDIRVLDDGRFAYPVILDSGREQRNDNLILLRELVDSIHAIPHRGEVLSKESKDSMEHWAE